MFDKIEKTINCPKIIIDVRKASFLATEHLIKNGCNKILLLDKDFNLKLLWIAIWGIAML